ncbi:alpha/beta hydrolase [Spongiibacter sp. KMU-166]|uniref:Alpha/beta hydrolase n=1 Tax=Spongiibacter thalassae TaxID=2721624 RepID=A0ABX1GDL0_9GAMM|nr:alpha/beta hydrolase [Spongiibacter thalassae]NKI16563.1 alpha/beta hydrolase [Spongiibacter thalassae]
MGGVHAAGVANTFSPSWSEYLPIRGVNYHIRQWGRAGAPKVFLFHGWMDSSVTWQFVVDEILAKDSNWHFIAPDWSGYGHSEPRPGGSMFIGFLGDMEQVIRHYAPTETLKIIAHSMGANLSSIYASARAERVSHFVNLEGLAPMPGGEFGKPLHYQVARWLNGSRGRTRAYSSREAFVERLTQQNPRLSQTRAAFLAEHFLQADEEGGFVPRAEVEARQVAPIYPHPEQVKELLRHISAKVLVVRGTDSFVSECFAGHDDVLAERLACYQHRSDLVLQGASHNMHQEFPAEVAQASLALFAR